MTPSITIARAADLGEVRQLLAACRLPTDDIGHDGLFVVARSGEELCGTAGMESFGAIGLLRSVAVHPPWRRQGIARALCDEVMRDARRAGVGRLFLLTTDAQTFFRGLGFAEVKRDLLPPAIRETAQFRELCPQTATAMSRDV